MKKWLSFSDMARDSLCAGIDAGEWKRICKGVTGFVGRVTKGGRVVAPLTHAVAVKVHAADQVHVSDGGLPLPEAALLLQEPRPNLRAACIMSRSSPRSPCSSCLLAPRAKSES